MQVMSVSWLVRGRCVVGLGSVRCLHCCSVSLCCVLCCVLLFAASGASDASFLDGCMGWMLLCVGCTGCFIGWVYHWLACIGCFGCNVKLGFRLRRLAAQTCCVNNNSPAFCLELIVVFCVIVVGFCWRGRRFENEQTT